MEDLTATDEVADIQEESWWKQSIHWTECLWWILVADILIFLILMAAFNVHSLER